MNTKRNLGLIAGTFVALALGATARADTYWYVDADATGADDGTSWADAFTDLQCALPPRTNPEHLCIPENRPNPCSAESPCVVWVAAETYEPTSGKDRSISFELLDFVKVYGGFDGTEDPLTFDLRDRDFQANETILSGDLDEDDGPDPFQDNDENAFNVVLVSLTNLDWTRLDGFTITAGNEPRFIFPDYTEAGGGGIHFGEGGSAKIYNCRIVGNFADNGGGGIYLTNVQGASPWIVNCVIADNQAGHGGAIAGKATGSVEIVNCQILRNVSEDTDGGGGIYLSAGDPLIVNSLIAGNQTVAAGGGDGGGIRVKSGVNLRIVNSTIADNSATNGGRGGGIYQFSSFIDIDNTIIWGNDATEGKQIYASAHPDRIFVESSDVARDELNSDVVGPVTFEGTGNIEVNPLFADSGAGDYRLQTDSLCIGAADNCLVPDDEWDVDGDGCADVCVFPSCCEPTPDLDLNLRIGGFDVDMGTYEYAEACDPNCDDAEACTTDTCTEGVCEYVCRNHPYGDISPIPDPPATFPCDAEELARAGNGFVNILDVMCA